MATKLSELTAPPNPEEAAQDLQRFRDDLQYLGAIQADLYRSHPGQWVAIYQRQVVATADNLPQLVEQLHAKDIAPANAVMEQLLPPDRLVAL